MVHLLITWSHTVFSTLLLQLLHRMLCDGQLFSSPLFPCLPCRGPVSLWLSTELHQMEVISFISCVPLKHELLGNWTSPQISAQLSLELTCDKMQKGLFRFRLHGWSSCNSCIYIESHVSDPRLRGKKRTFALQEECVKPSSEKLWNATSS